MALYFIYHREKKWYNLFWYNETYLLRGGEIDIIKAYNQIKIWQQENALFRKPKLKSAQYINLPLLNFISTLENATTEGCNQSRTDM
jgi:hypothetical protein